MKIKLIAHRLVGCGLSQHLLLDFLSERATSDWQRRVSLSVKQMFMTTLGIFLLILGLIGIVIPILPTTPFVLGAVACLSGNPKLQKKIKAIPLFGEIIENYQNNKSISPKTLFSSVSFLWISLIFSSVIIGHFWVVIGLFCIGVAVTIHLIRLSRNYSKHPKS